MFYIGTTKRLNKFHYVNIPMYTYNKFVTYNQLGCILPKIPLVLHHASKRDKNTNDHLMNKLNNLALQRAQRGTHSSICNELQWNDPYYASLVVVASLDSYSKDRDKHIYPCNKGQGQTHLSMAIQHNWIQTNTSIQHQVVNKHSHFCLQQLSLETYTSNHK